MRANQIKVGGRYEVKAGRSTTVVKVKSVNKKTGGWKCQTANGKILNVAAPDRFVKEVVAEKKQEPDTKPTLKEFIEAKGITVIPRGRRATSSMRDLDDPTFSRKHHVTKKGVLVFSQTSRVSGTRSSATSAAPEFRRRGPKFLPGTRICH